MAWLAGLLGTLVPLGLFVAVLSLLEKEGVTRRQACLALWPLPIYAGLYLTAWLRPSWRSSLAARLGDDWRVALVLSLWMVLSYITYAMAGAGLSVQGVGLAFYFWGGLALLAWAAQRHGQGFGVWDAILWLFLWANIEFNALATAYAWPSGHGGILVLLGATLWLLTYYDNGRQMPHLQASAAISRGEAGIALREGAMLLALAIPLGLGTGFIEWQGLANVSHWYAPLGTAVAVFFLTALPEELLFRAVMQNALTRWLGRPLLALGISAIFFGLTHLNNGPTPDWRYAVLATIAGWFYGRTYARTGNVTAPALVHMVVDTCWVTFFRSPTH